MAAYEQEDGFVVDSVVSSEASYASSTSSNDLNQDGICQKCGVSDCSNLSIYCDVCHIVAEHTRADKLLGPAPGDEQIEEEALPVRDTVWRGSFEISGCEYGPLEGHISNKACLKVWQAANELPSLMRMELPSRIDVWPKKFDKSPPTGGDVGLYFFPDELRENSDFTKLVDDMKSKDLALKFVSGNAELLIFPSHQLPEFYQTFREAHYLWGVFRNRKVPVSSSACKHQ